MRRLHMEKTIERRIHEEMALVEAAAKKREEVAVRWRPLLS